MSIQTVKAIDGIKFCVWSPNEIRKYSVSEITAPETYDEDGMAVQGGLMDGTSWYIRTWTKMSNLW